MSKAEIKWLQERAAGRNTIAEIGSWMGVTTAALADATQGKVFAVDTWEGSEEHKAFLADKPADYLYSRFLETVGERRIVPLRMTSLEAAEQLNRDGVQLDMIFIDAAHDYENVKADILAWRPLLRAGGLFSGHDFDSGRVGVVRAVRELVKVIGRGAGSIWYAEC